MTQLLPPNFVACRKNMTKIARGKYVGVNIHNNEVNISTGLVKLYYYY